MKELLYDLVLVVYAVIPSEKPHTNLAEFYVDESSAIHNLPKDKCKAMEGSEKYEDVLDLEKLEHRVWVCRPPKSRM